jgi:hypothetical protein
VLPSSLQPMMLPVSTAELLNTWPRSGNSEPNRTAAYPASHLALYRQCCQQTVIGAAPGAGRPEAPLTQMRIGINCKKARATLYRHQLG